MKEERRSVKERAGAAAAVVLVGLAVGLLVLLLAGLLVSALTVQGVMSLDNLVRGSLVSLFLAALAGGLVTAWRMRRMRLAWSMCAGAALAAVCLLAGLLCYGGGTGAAVLSRTAAALLGAAVGGVLAAARKK